MGTGLESCQVCKTFSSPICKQFYCKLSTRTVYIMEQDNIVCMCICVVRGRGRLAESKGEREAAGLRAKYFWNKKIKYSCYAIKNLNLNLKGLNTALYV